MKIYLASPFFNDNEIANIHRAAEILKAKGHEVLYLWSTMLRTGKALPMQNGQRKFLKLTKAELTIAMRLFCFTVECTPTAELRGSADMPMRQAKSNSVLL